MIYRDALCRYIRQADKDFQITDCGEGAELAAQCAKGNADLILVASDFRGLENRDDLKNTKVGLMVKNPDASFDQNDFAGIFPKSLSSKDFVAGIRAILAGEKFVPEVDDRAPAQPALKGSPRSIHGFGLSPREKEVLTHLVKGASNKEIARALDLQVVTIKLHVRGICRKLDASNRTQAALMAQECGWT